MVDTFKNIYLGNQALFKGLWIYDKIEWHSYPVIHLDFSRIQYEGFGLSTAIMKDLDRVAVSYGLHLESKTPKGVEVQDYLYLYHGI